MNKEKENCEHYFACALCGEEQSVSDLLKKRDEQVLEKCGKVAWAGDDILCKILRY